MSSNDTTSVVPLSSSSSSTDGSSSSSPSRRLRQQQQQRRRWNLHHHSSAAVVPPLSIRRNRRDSVSTNVGGVDRDEQQQQQQQQQQRTVPDTALPATNNRNATTTTSIQPPSSASLSLPTVTTTTTTTTTATTNTNTNNVEWRRQQQQQQERDYYHRQRSVRVLLFFLFIILLFDEENQNNSTIMDDIDSSITTPGITTTTSSSSSNVKNHYQLRRREYNSNNNNNNIVGGDGNDDDNNFIRNMNHYNNNNYNNNKSNVTLSSIQQQTLEEQQVQYYHRLVQDVLLQYVTQNHVRYQYLIHDKNNNIDIQNQLCIVQDELLFEQIQVQQQQLLLSSSSSSSSSYLFSNNSDSNTNSNNYRKEILRMINKINLIWQHENSYNNFMEFWNIATAKGSSSGSSNSRSSSTSSGGGGGDYYYTGTTPTTNNNNNNNDIVYHYPWNVTGFYRGSWKRITTTPPPTTAVLFEQPEQQQQPSRQRRQEEMNYNNSTTPMLNNSTIEKNPSVGQHRMVNTEQMEEYMIQKLRQRASSRIMEENVYTDNIGSITTRASMISPGIVQLPYGHHFLEYYYNTHQISSSNHNNNNISNSAIIENLLQQWNHPYNTIHNRSNRTLQQQNKGGSHKRQQKNGMMNEYSTKDIISKFYYSRKIQQQYDNVQNVRNDNNNNNNNNLNNDDTNDYDDVPKISLSRDDGKAAFQLFGKRILGMKEISYVTGFIKLYDTKVGTSSSSSSNTGGSSSSSRDVLLRVHGILLHSIGRLSLVANMDHDSIALVIDPNNSYNNNHNSRRNGSDHYQRRRKLQASVGKILDDAKPLSTSSFHRVPADIIAALRLEALALYGESINSNSWMDNNKVKFISLDELFRNSVTGTDIIENLLLHQQKQEDAESSSSNNHVKNENSKLWSDYVIPYPFVRDEASIRSSSSGSKRTTGTTTATSSKSIPLREQALEANAAGCSFEITMDVSEVEWTVGLWKKLLERRYAEKKLSDPYYVHRKGDTELQRNILHRHILPYKSSRSNGISNDYPTEALAMNMVGEIHSYNCNFHAQINTTALRTDWDATTSKAINYSFYMMLVCLTQIFILLRQLLHSQSQSIAIRVSLICIGWQTVIDALLCLIHIYLSLAVQPLFTAFASVAFFKLLIFCAIEMKYMAIILHARNNSSGGTLSADALRQQIALLHIKFYLALTAIFIIIFYAPGKYRTYTILGLYSFWVPQIISNIITEAKTPLHKNYIYGMSITRLIAPLYVFGLRNNFLKEVYPESTTNPFMCQLLILWIGCQAAVLIAQGKYGARFMIPKRFLPPKFDYSRPIPASMLPPGVQLELPTSESMDDRTNDSLQPMGSTKREDGDNLNPNNTSTNPEADQRLLPMRHQTADTTRNRHHRGGRRGITTTSRHAGSNSNNNGNAMVKEDLPQVLPKPAPTPSPVLECSICFDSIDIRDRFKYMLAPCNHLYHSECLKQWMELKMECPICRTQLPAL